MKFSTRRSPGFTLIETTLAIAVTGLIFGMTAYMIFLTTRNSYHLHEQFMSQRSAGAGAERLASLVRNAIGFRRYAGDAGTTISRVKVVFASSPTATFTHTIAQYNIYKTVNGVQKVDKSEIRYYEKELVEADFDSMGSPAKPNPKATEVAKHRFTELQKFDILWQTEYHLTLAVHYKYRGFALLGDPYQDMTGQFITDIIARNHAMDEGVDNYAAADTTSGPASLAGY